MQTKKQSFIESITQSVIGLSVSFAVSPFIYWAVDMPYTYLQLGKTTILFYLVGLIRSYLIRRFFAKVGNTPHLRLVELTSLQMETFQQTKKQMFYKDIQGNLIKIEYWDDVNYAIAYKYKIYTDETIQ